MSIESLKNLILENLKATKREGMDNLINWLVNSDFFTAPASTRYHGDYEGGLAEHSFKTMRVYEKLVETFKRNVPKDSIIIGGLLHDICKVNFYKTETRNRKVDGKWEQYNAYTIADQEPLGHGAKSIIIISRYLKLTELESYSIMWHMGRPSEYMENCSYNSAIEKYPDCLLLHLADNMSSNIFEESTRQKLGG